MKRLIRVSCMLLSLALLAGCLAACGNAQKETPSDTAPVTPPSEEVYEPELFNHLATSEELQSVLVKEKGTSARVDEIALYAKATVGHLGIYAEDTAISAIRETYPEFYSSQEQMELFMFYGYYLDYAFDDGTPQSELGADLYQAIKYVYRGAEKIEDASTQSNLEQIAKSLEQLPESPSE